MRATGASLTCQPVQTALLLALGSTTMSCGVGTPCAPPTALCNSTEGEDEAGRFSGFPKIDRVQLDCCDPEDSNDGRCRGAGEWWVDVMLTGNVGRLQVTRTALSNGGWQEVHTVRLYARDPAGYWESRYGEWDIADTTDCEDYQDCADRFVSGSRTLFTCGSDSFASVRTTIEAFEVGNPDPVDCVSWGAAIPAAPDGCRDANGEGVL
jgi:hypothetical protein